jgi:hypothetical protein
MNIIRDYIEVSLVLDVFSSIVDIIYPLSKISLVEKVYKLGENGFFKKP